MSTRAHAFGLATLAFALIHFAAPIYGSQAGSSGDCDPGLRRPEGNPPNAYAQRQGRCEGIYAKEVAGANLAVASFARQFDLDPKAGDAIRLNWSTPTHSAVHLRAVSLKPRLFYRMDTTRPAGTDSWMWPTDVLNVLGFDKTSLGIVATTKIPLGDMERVIYLPLQVSSKGTPPTSPPYQVLLRSDVELSEVYVSIAELDKQGKPAKYLRQNKPLNYGLYPAERGIPVDIDVSELRKGTIYQLDVGAALRTGGSANIKFWIYGGT